MPNWCECELQIVGPKATITKIREAITSGDKIVLTNLAPIPEELSCLSTGHTTIDGVAHSVWRQTDEGAVPVDTKPLIDKYGTASWYDWANTHWGTKWGDCDTKIQDDLTDPMFYVEDGEDVEDIKLAFSSAWSPPMQLLTTIAESHPDITLGLRYWECGMGFQGQAIWEDGSLTSDDTMDYRGSRGG